MGRRRRGRGWWWLRFKMQRGKLSELAALFCDGRGRKVPEQEEGSPASVGINLFFYSDIFYSDIHRISQSDHSASMPAAIFILVFQIKSQNKTYASPCRPSHASPASSALSRPSANGDGCSRVSAVVVISTKSTVSTEMIQSTASVMRPSQRWSQDASRESHCNISSVGHSCYSCASASH